MSHARTPTLAWRAFVLTAVMLTLSSAAFAQWQWIDGTGRKVFSDTAPPTSIPAGNILKQPAARVAAAGATTPSTSPDTTAPTASAPASPVPARETELEARKKQAEQAEEARKKAELDRVVKARAESCERARKAKITIDSGLRLATTNARGEREIMDDKARAAEAQRMDGIIRSDCGPLPKASAQTPAQ